MAVLADELATKLEASNLNAKITIGEAPPKPDRCVTVFHSPAGGFAPDNDMGAANPVILFQCRDSGEVDTEELAWQVHSLFNDQQMYTLTEIYVVQSEATLAPIRVGRDDGNRTLFNVSIRFKVETPTV